MKKFFLFLLPILFLASCKNLEQFKAPIENLTTDWDKSSSEITKIGSMLSGTTTMLSGLKDSLIIDPAVMAKMKPAKSSLLDSMKTIFMTQLDGLNVISSEVTTFSSSWSEMSGKLNSLKEGLASGKLEGDVMAQINELKTVVQDATAKSEVWNKRVEGTKTTALTAYDLFKQTLMSN